jgi:prepilin-type N-terminal cleavage/methylation domain-containing protein
MRNNKGFTLLELLIVVVILGVLALIAAPTLLNAADKAKVGAVKANVSAAASTVTTYLAVDEMTGANASSTAIETLNNGGDGTADTEDDACSPFDSVSDMSSGCNIDAYTDASPEKGQVVIAADGSNEYAVNIKGYGKDGSTVVAAKTVRAPQSSASS